MHSYEDLHITYEHKQVLLHAAEFEIVHWCHKMECQCQLLRIVGEVMDVATGAA